MYFLNIFLLLLIVTFPALAKASSNCCPTEQKAAAWCKPSTKHLPSWYLDIGFQWLFDQRFGANYLSNLELPSDTLTSPKANKVPIAFLSGGYVWPRQSDWLPFTSLGIEYSYAFSTKVKGILEDYSEIEEANHSYQYKIMHQGISLLGKVALMRWKNCLPYVSAGLGASWNRLSDYSEQEISERISEHTDPEFPNKTTVDFSYSLGAGLDYVFTEHLWVGLGYRFDHFGKVGTGDSLLHNKLFHEHINDSLRAHSINVSLRYLFG